MPKPGGQCVTTTTLAALLKQTIAADVAARPPATGDPGEAGADASATATLPAQAGHVRRWPLNVHFGIRVTRRAQPLPSQRPAPCYAPPPRPVARALRPVRLTELSRPEWLRLRATVDSGRLRARGNEEDQVHSWLGHCQNKTGRNSCSEPAPWPRQGALPSPYPFNRG